jgi:hypothetical protein
MLLNKARQCHCTVSQPNRQVVVSHGRTKYCLLRLRRVDQPKSLAASASPVSTHNIYIFCLRFSRNAVPIGFCWGGFSSTDGYVPVNEAQLLSLLSDFCYLPVVPCQKILFVFIRTTWKSFSTFSWAKPFGFDSRRNSNFFPSFAALKQCVTALFASPCIGQTPVSIFLGVLRNTVGRLQLSRTGVSPCFPLLSSSFR